MKKETKHTPKPRMPFPEQKLPKQPKQSKQPLKTSKTLKQSKKTTAEQQSNQQLTTPPIKVVFLGDGNCGKTSALISYTTDIFNSDYTPTIFDTYETIIKKGDHVVKLELWDTAGQQQYKKLRSLSYPKTDVFLICFSMIEKKSFMNAISKWYNEVKENCPRAEIIFVGTKIDLIADFVAINKTQNLLDKEKIEKKITSMGHKLLLCSSLTQQGLNEVFDTAIDIMIKKREVESDVFKKASEMDCQLI